MYFESILLLLLSHIYIFFVLYMRYPFSFVKMQYSRLGTAFDRSPDRIKSSIALLSVASSQSEKSFWKRIKIFVVTFCTCWKAPRSPEAFVKGFNFTNSNYICSLGCAVLNFNVQKFQIRNIFGNFYIDGFSLKYLCEWKYIFI